MSTVTKYFSLQGRVSFFKRQPDGSKGAGCEHVALAVRGFRQRPDGGLAVFGTWGALIGPLIVRLAVEALSIDREEPR